MATPDNDTHERLFFEFPRTEPRTSYLVCSVPRSGSSLLCELLAGTGIAGAPAEFFHPEKMEALQQRWGAATIDEYVRELLARKTSPNGVFGVKAHMGQYRPLFADADPAAILPNPAMILITRRDRLRQAVSWVRAQQTMRWATQGGPKRDRPAVFDADHISRMLRRIDREETLWEELFERHGLTPHRLVYEEFVEAQEASVRDVLEAIGVEAPAGLAVAPPTLDRQADALSDEWIERYRAETGA